MTLLDRIKSLLGLGSTRSESPDRDVEVAVDDTPPDRSTDDESTTADESAAMEADESTTETDDEPTDQKSAAMEADESTTETDDGPTDQESAAMETDNPEDWGVPPGYDGDESDVQAGPEAFADETGGEESDTPAESRDETNTGSSNAVDGGSVAVGIEDAEAETSSNTASIDEQSASEDTSQGESAVTDGPIEEAEPDTDETPSEESDLDTASEGPELTEIKGIGPAYEQRLIDAGVASVEALRDADTATLAERTDLSETRVGRWQERAAALLE